MINTPRCFSEKRKCVHFIGIKQSDGTEESEIVICKAFPSGIPSVIAYGNNLHEKVEKGQTGTFVFEEVK